MNEVRKTKTQLIKELLELRLQVAELRKKETSPPPGNKMETSSMDLYRDLVENTNDLIQTISPEGRFLYVNRAWLDTLGYCEADIPNLSLEDIIHNGSKADYNMIIQRLLAGQKLEKVKAEVIAKDGRKIVVEVSAHCKFLDNKPVYVQCILRDITDRRKSEEELLGLQAKESSILSAIPHAVVGLKDRKIIFANEAVKEVFGWKPDELINKSTRVLYRNDDEYEEIGSHFYPVLEEQMTHSEDFYCRHRDGRDILCRISASVIGEKLQEKGIVVMYEDITTSKRIEEALKESEKKYIDLYQNAPDGYHSLGPDGTILEANDTWLRMFGYESDELVGKKKFTDLLTDEGLRIFHDTFPKLKQRGYMENLEYYVKRKDGSLLPVLINATAIYDDRGNFLKTRSIVRDISTRMSYREMLERALSEWKITFDSMPYGVMMVSSDMTVMRTNKYISSLYGATYEDMKGKKYFELIYGNNKPVENCPMMKSHNTHKTHISEYYDTRCDKYFMMQATPIPDKQGLINAGVLAMVDISDIKDKEKRLTDSRDAFFNMLKEVDFSYRELKGLFEGLIHSFVTALDAKSPWTKGHSERVTNYALEIAKEMGLAEEDIENLRIAALLHDIGKIGTYDIILDKPKKLSPEEYGLVNQHPVKGEEILRPIKQLQHLLPIIRHHHERIDGGGYPDGLMGDEIPLLSRILCIADSFDSMTSDRPYRAAAVREFAIFELKRCSGTQFDSRAVEAFLRYLNKDNS